MTSPRNASVRGIPAADYHADRVADRPTLSASIASILLNGSPRHAWHAHPKLNPDFVRGDDKKYDFGTCVHALLLERDAGKAEVLDFPDWRTNAAKEARDAARDAGKVPILAKDWERVVKVVVAVHERLADYDADPPVLHAGKPEQTLVWEDNGVLCRALVDWLHDGYRACDDLKTTSVVYGANPANFKVPGREIQAAMYVRAVRAITGVTPVFRWVVVETAPPFELSVIEPDPAALALGDDKVNRALAIWRDCLERDVWPGYPQRVATVELPPWEEARWLEREAIEEAA